MISAFITLIGMIPGLAGVAERWHAANLDKQVRMYIAKTGASKEVALAAVTAAVSLSTKLWWLAGAFGLAFVPWVWKAAFYDKVVCPFIWTAAEIGDHFCSTDPLRGDLQWTFTVIIGSLFGYAAVLAYNRST